MRGSTMFSNIGRLAGGIGPAPPLDAELSAAAAAELSNLAVSTAVSASLVNEMWQTPTHRPPVALAAVVPATPILLRAAVTRASGPNSAAILAAHDNAIRLLGVVRRLAADAIAKQYGCTNAALFELTGVLRDLCGTTADLVRMTETTRVCAAVDEAETICALLSRCASGEAPCAEAGKPIYPVWYDRRAERRFSVNMAALITARERRVQVVVMDASRTGFGVRGCMDMGTGEPVGLELWNGRMLEGIVAWHRKWRAGIKLLQPLAYDDPLISTD